MEERLEKTIAVLPFINRSSVEDAEYFSDGMTEEIINALSKIQDLKVTSRTSSFSFKGKEYSISEIAEKLNVNYIIEGSVRLSGNKARISAQLINAREDYQYWSESYDRSLENVFVVQDEISLIIAEKLREFVGHFDLDDQLVESFDISTEVYKKYLRGRHEIMKIELNSTLKGIAILEEVILEAPDYPYSYLDLNQAYTYLGVVGYLNTKEAFLKSGPYMEKAIQVGPGLAKTQLNLAWRACFQDYDLPTAYEYLRKSIAIKPTDEAFLSVSNIMAIEGKLSTAHVYIDKALQIDPMNVMNNHLKGFVYYLQEDYENALLYAEKSLALGNVVHTHQLKGFSLILSGRAEEGLRYFENLDPMNDNDFLRIGGQAIAHTFLGNMEEAARFMEMLYAAKGTETYGSAHFFILMVRAQLGTKEEVIQLMKDGLVDSKSLMVTMFNEPLLKKYHKDKEFIAIRNSLITGSFDVVLEEKKYKKSVFDLETMELQKQRLEKLMKEEQPYLDSKVSLRKLAENMGMQANYLSQLLNEGFNKNFSEYINDYRLITFKELVRDDSRRHLTLLALAYESGFNSKTVFNTYFKKSMGMTPKAYWNSIHNV